MFWGHTSSALGDLSTHRLNLLLARKLVLAKGLDSVNVDHVLPHVADLRELAQAVFALVGLDSHVLPQMILEVTCLPKERRAIV